MKGLIPILFVSIILSGCVDKSSVDCSKIIDGNLLTEYKVSSARLGEKRFSKYLSEEEKYYNDLLELQTEQKGDTLIVKYYKLGGNTTIDCVEIKKSNSKIDVINYESNYLKEITILEIEYRIENIENLKLGKVEFVALKKIENK